MVKMLKSVDIFTRGYIGSKRIRFQKKAGAPKAAQKSKGEKSLKMLDFSA